MKKKKEKNRRKEVRLSFRPLDYGRGKKEVVWYHNPDGHQVVDYREIEAINRIQRTSPNWHSILRGLPGGIMQFREAYLKYDNIGADDVSIIGGCAPCPWCGLDNRHVPLRKLGEKTTRSHIECKCCGCRYIVTSTRYRFISKRDFQSEDEGMFSRDVFSTRRTSSPKHPEEHESNLDFHFQGKKDYGWGMTVASLEKKLVEIEGDIKVLNKLKRDVLEWGRETGKLETLRDGSVWFADQTESKMDTPFGKVFFHGGDPCSVTPCDYDRKSFRHGAYVDDLLFAIVEINKIIKKKKQRKEITNG